MKTKKEDLVFDPNPDNINIGLTKREHFAALNLAALISATMSNQTILIAMSDAAKRKGLDPDDYMAKESVAMADKLIKALNDET